MNAHLWLSCSNLAASRSRPSSNVIDAVFRHQNFIARSLQGVATLRLRSAALVACFPVDQSPHNYVSYTGLAIDSFCSKE